MMDICVDDPEARLARQLDRQINEELRRARQQMVVNISRAVLWVGLIG